MTKKYFISILFVFLVFTCNAQISFSCTVLEDLYNRLPEQAKNTIMEIAGKSQNSHLDTLINWNGKVLSVVLEDGILYKLGIHLTGMSHFNQYDSVVIAFIERALLRFSFDKTIPDILSTAESMQIRMLYQGNTLLFSPINSFNELLDSINTSKQFKLSQNDYLFYAAWENGNNNIFEFIFPNNYQLLVGKNKKELDEDILAKLTELNFNSSVVEPQELFLTSADTLPIVVLKGTNYLDKLSSEVFFKLHGEDSVLVFEENLIPYSVSNLFLNKELGGKRTLQMNYKMYGRESNISSLYLQNFIGYLEENGFQGFVGHENSELNLIEGTVVFRHTFFNYIHMLHFKTNATEVFNPNGNIAADFYANIPMHNVSNLMKEYESANHKQVIDVIIKDP